MTPEQFAYWLQGFAEMNPDRTPTNEQWQSIKDHLKTVFVKITPTYKPVPIPDGPIFPQEQPFAPSPVICKSPLEGMTYC